MNFLRGRNGGGGGGDGGGDGGGGSGSDGGSNNGDTRQRPEAPGSTANRPTVARARPAPAPAPAPAPPRPPRPVLRPWHVAFNRSMKNSFRRTSSFNGMITAAHAFSFLFAIYIALPGISGPRMAYLSILTIAFAFMRLWYIGAILEHADNLYACYRNGINLLILSVVGFLLNLILTVTGLKFSFALYRCKSWSESKICDSTSAMFILTGFMALLWAMTGAIIAYRLRKAYPRPRQAPQPGTHELNNIATN